MASELTVGSVKTAGNIHMDATKPVLHLDGAGAAAVSSAIYFTEAGHEVPPTAGSYAGSIEYDGVGNQLIIGGYTNNVAYQSMKIPRSSGSQVTFSGGVNIAAGGVKFPAAQSASADANTLDDYEEGTFTATLTSVTPPTTPPTVTSYYTKIGRLVSFTIVFNDVDTSGGSGAISITGLPFTPATRYMCSTLFLYNMDFDASKSLLTFIEASSTTVSIYEIVSGGLMTGLGMTAGTGKYFGFSGTYHV
jgi:hypothetical protein